ncbi:hypothetical protein L9F63_001366, partial [Diploptera punctata]
ITKTEIGKDVTFRNSKNLSKLYSSFGYILSHPLMGLYFNMSTSTYQQVDSVASERRNLKFRNTDAQLNRYSLFKEKEKK